MHVILAAQTKMRVPRSRLKPALDSTASWQPQLHRINRTSCPVETHEALEVLLIYTNTTVYRAKVNVSSKYASHQVAVLLLADPKTRALCGRNQVGLVDSRDSVNFLR